jgi:alpha-tubulin suppressor-like RCC1 family protein
MQEQSSMQDFNWCDLPTEMKLYALSFFDLKGLFNFIRVSVESAFLAIEALSPKVTELILANIFLGLTETTTFCFTREALYFCGLKDASHRQALLTPIAPADEEKKRFGWAWCDWPVAPRVQIKTLSEINEIDHIRKIIPHYLPQDHILTLTDSGLWAWNIYGQIFDPEANDLVSSVLLYPQEIGRIKCVVAGSCYLLLLSEEGFFVSGINKFGQLGVGDRENRLNFTKVIFREDIGDILQIAAGYAHALILTQKGLFACGGNKFGQLGLGDNEDRLLFTQVPLPPEVRIIYQVIAEERNTFLLTNNGLFVCGSCQIGDFGSNHVEVNNRFEKISLPEKIRVIKKIFVGAYHYFLLTDAGVFGAGRNERGELGLGHHKDCRELTQIPWEVEGQIIEIMTGRFRTFFITTHGIYASGHNEDGMLGVGHASDCNRFTRVILPKELKVYFELHPRIERIKTILTCLSRGQIEDEKKSVPGSYFFSPKRKLRSFSYRHNRLVKAARYEEVVYSANLNT